MNVGDLLGSSGTIWLIFAVIFGLAELAVPGVFLIFLAIAAAITGVTLLALPMLPLAAQLGSFAAWSAIAVLIGKRWYVDYPIESADPLLNDRAARLIGAIVPVFEPIQDGTGRVRVGDSVWPARGPDASADDSVRIVGIDSGVLVVEPAAEHGTPPAR